MSRNPVAFETLLGRTLVSVEGAKDGSERVTITCDDGAVFAMYHEQDCCESVALESVVGDVANLIGSPLTLARKSSSEEYPAHHPKPEYHESGTWTFYSLATVKGYVDFRWLGESNGYYSESVSLYPEEAPNAD